jgi:hypothetical protein
MFEGNYSFMDTDAGSQSALEVGRYSETMSSKACL